MGREGWRLQPQPPCQEQALPGPAALPEGGHPRTGTPTRITCLSAAILLGLPGQPVLLHVPKPSHPREDSLRPRTAPPSRTRCPEQPEAPAGLPLACPLHPALHHPRQSQRAVPGDPGRSQTGKPTAALVPDAVAARPRSPLPCSAETWEEPATAASCHPSRELEKATAGRGPVPAVPRQPRSRCSVALHPPWQGQQRKSWPLACFYK